VANTLGESRLDLREQLTVAARTPAAEEAVGDARHRERAARVRRVRNEFALRVVVCVIILAFNELFMISGDSHALVRATALAGALINAPYYVAVRAGRWRRGQAHLRMGIDVVFITTGLYAAGGLAAAPYLAVYSVVPVYAAFALSRRASLVATWLATVAFIGLALLQWFGALPMTRAPMPDAWQIVVFNLLVLNIVGWMAATLAQAYRKSRRRLATLCEELERAHDESLRLNEHLQRASRMSVLTEVVAGVTHELRDVLQDTFSHLWLARRKLPDSATEVIEHLNQVETTCERAMRIIRTTLDMSRPSDEPRERVSVATVVGRVAELKAFGLRRDGIALRIEVPGDLPPVACTKFQLQQVLTSLVTNAQEELRQVRGRRDIVISAVSEPDRCIVDVRDTGRGVPIAALPHLFEPFYTTKSTGTGLGLAICAGIAESCGGTLTAANHREGGAVFRLTLPAARWPA
jgi:signal transduction histidine kinase